MDQPITIIITIISTIGVLLGGSFGVKLLKEWGDRDARRAKATADSVAVANETASAVSRHQFEDSEQARMWLKKQLEERDEELRQFRERERLLMERVGSLAEQVARQEERSSAQALQITALQKLVEKWNTDYAELKSERDRYRDERDRYRDEKHDLENKLVPSVLKTSMLERDLEIRNAEIERLKGQIAVLTPLDRSIA